MSAYRSSLWGLIEPDARARLMAHLQPLIDPEPMEDTFRRAAVLAVLYPEGGQVWIPLIKRADYPGVHGGQIALPGGAYEPGDKSLVDTALREAKEEVDLEPRKVTLLGRLPSVVVAASGFEVTPYVAWIDDTPALRPHDREVESIIPLPVDMLLDPSAVRELPAPPGSRNPTYYEFDLGGQRLWGATARMMVSLGTVLRESFEP